MEHSVVDTETGSYLPWKAHRLRGRVTLEAIADVTKISKRFLEAIESGDYRQLPGGLFTTSYIRQYAEQIGFDCDEILLHHGSGLKGKEAVAAADAPRWGKGLIAGVLEKV